MTTEQAKSLSEAAISNLTEALERGQSEAFKLYLSVMSRFHRYSIVGLSRSANQAACRITEEFHANDMTNRHCGMRTHHGESCKAREARERIRAEQRKQEEPRKEDLATRRRILSAILGRVSPRLQKLAWM